MLYRLKKTHKKLSIAYKVDQIHFIVPQYFNTGKAIFSTHADNTLAYFFYNQMVNNSQHQPRSW